MSTRSVTMGLVELGAGVGEGGLAALKGPPAFATRGLAALELPDAVGADFLELAAVGVEEDGAAPVEPEDEDDEAEARPGVEG